MNVTVTAEAMSSDKLCSIEMPAVPAQEHVDTETKLLMVQVSRARFWTRFCTQRRCSQSRASPCPSGRLDGASGCCKVQESISTQPGERLCSCLGTTGATVSSLPFWGETGRFEAAGCAMFSLLPSSQCAQGCYKDRPGFYWLVRAAAGNRVQAGCALAGGTFLGQRQADSDPGLIHAVFLVLKAPTAM